MVKTHTLLQGSQSSIKLARSTFRYALLATALATLVACGGGSHNSSSNSGGGGGTTSQVSGTAAAGAPIAGATITLKDAGGQTATATTASDGTFQIDVTNLTAPFLLRVSSNSTTFYSYASAPGTTANVTPYTSLTLQSYYLAQGSTVATVFGGTLNSNSFPSSQQLATLANSVVTILQPYLTSAGVSNPSQFDLFATTFTANHSGFDQILDRTVVGNDLESFNVDNGNGSTAGAVSSTVTVTATTSSSSSIPANVAFSTVTNNSNGGSSSTSVQNNPVGNSPAQQSDLSNAQSGVVALFNSLASAATSKGSSFSVADAEAFIDPAFLDDGQDAAHLANDVQQFFSSIPAGATVTASIIRVNSFTDNSATDQTLNATLHLVVQSGSTIIGDQYIDSNDDPSSGQVYHLDSSGKWKFYGRQSHAKAHVNIEANRFYDPVTAADGTTALLIQGQLGADQSLALTSVGLASTTANSLPDCTSYANGTTPVPMTNNSLMLMHDSGTFNGNEDRYDLPCHAMNMPGQSSPVAITSNTAPPAGTVYTFTLSNSGGVVGTQTWRLNGATSEVGDIATINGSARTTFVNSSTVSSVAGTQLTIGFTPPVSFPLLYSYISAFCENAAEASGGGGNDIQGDASQIPAGTNSGTITIPNQCDGASPVSLSIDVNFVGRNGERSYVTQNLNH